MKRGYLGPYQLGALEGASEALQITANLTKQRSADIDAIFYAAAFQAGVDEFLISESMADKRGSQSQFVATRTSRIPDERARGNHDVVNKAFSAYLPEDWRGRDEFLPVGALLSFVADLLDSSDARASLLLPIGLPEIEKAKDKLPSELYVPLSGLIAAIIELQTEGLAVRHNLPRDDLTRFNDIISGDIFTEYSAAQSQLDDSRVDAEANLTKIQAVGRKLFTSNRHWLSLKKSSVGLLQVTPRIVDAIFGKLPGTLAEVMTNAGLSFIETRRRIVIYDFRSSFETVLFSNLTRMIATSSISKEHQ